MSIDEEEWRQRYIDLAEAVRDLYFAAYWTPDRDCDGPKLWEAVRDCAGIEPGNSPSIDEIIGRLEKEGPSFDLDRQIMYVVYNTPTRHQAVGDMPPAYSVSLDDALTLVPGMYEGSVDLMSPAVGRFHARLWSMQNLTGPEHHGSGITPAIALCIAALKARLVST